MANAEPSPDSLRRGLESLPQELYDQIYNNVFTAAPGVRDLSNSMCKAVLEGRKLLSISRSSRTQYATTYYGTAGGKFFFGNCPDMVKIPLWYTSLPREHQALVREMVIMCHHKLADLAIASIKRGISEYGSRLMGNGNSAKSMAAKVFVQTSGLTAESTLRE